MDGPNLKFGLVLLATLWLTQPAAAQNAIGDGRGLDNNLQQGTAGVNAPQRQPDFSSGNDIVTGNVPGLFYFHDDVGYSSTREFSDTLAEDHLFRFRAASLSPSLNVNLAVTPPTRVYRSSATTPGLIYPAYGSQPTFTDPGTLSGGGGGGEGPGLLGTSGLIVSPRAASSAWPTGTLGLVQQPDGRILELQASPLLGIRSVQTPARSFVPSVEEWNALQAQAAATQEPTAQPFAPDQTPQPLTYPTATVDATVRPWTPGMELGSLLAQPSSPETAAPNDPATQRAARVSSLLFNELGSAPQTPAGEDVYLDLLREIQGQPTTPDTPVAPDTPGVTSTVTQPPAQTTTSPTDLVDKLQYELPPILSFAGARKDTLGQLLAQAESEMAEGRYFDAERSYQNALHAGPHYPLARVGLVHAQIGAGLLRSAASNLRRLLELHPELIAARYDHPVVPTPQRLAWAVQESEKIVDEKSDPNAPILLAYLGYQTRDTDLTRRALDLARSAQPQDPLITLLDTIWLTAPPSK